MARPEIEELVTAIIDLATRCDHDVLLSEPCELCDAWVAEQKKLCSPDQEGPAP